MSATQEQQANRRAARRAAVRRPTATVEDDDDSGDEKQGATPAAASAPAAAMVEDADDDDADAEAMEELETPGARSLRQSLSRAHPTLESLGGARAATQLTQSGAQLVALGLPRGLQFGIDYWAFVVGDKFKGMKMIPPGVHYIWFSSVQNGGDMAPRVGFFVWLSAGEVLVRRWDPLLESLVQCADADEENRYVLGARRFDFDDGQGSYPLHAASKWSALVSHVDRALVERLEPVGKMISSFEVRKYKIEDKFAKEDTQQQGKKEEEGTEMTDAPASASSGPASSAAESSAAAAVAAASGSSAAAAPSPGDSAASKEDDGSSSGSKSSKFTSSPSTSFYSRVPTPASLVAASAIPKSDVAARAALLSSLHMDQTPLLEALLSTHSSSSSSSSSERYPGASLLGELQFSFVAFLIGQDAEGFEAWKSLTILLCSCVSALHTHHALYEQWVSVFAAQLSELPRDFFIDVLSGENFLGPCLQRLFDAALEPDLVIPASLSYALRELAEMVRNKFQAAPRHPLPAFKAADPATMALQAAAAAAAAAASTPAEEAKQKAGSDPLLTEEQRRAAEERQRRELLLRLQAEADDDEYAPTVADEEM